MATFHTLQRFKNYIQHYNYNSIFTLSVCPGMHGCLEFDLTVSFEGCYNTVKLPWLQYNQGTQNMMKCLCSCFAQKTLHEYHSDPRCSGDMFRESVKYPLPQA